MKRLDWSDLLIVLSIVTVLLGVWQVTPGWAMVLGGCIGVAGGVIVGTARRR